LPGNGQHKKNVTYLFLPAGAIHSGQIADNQILVDIHAYKDIHYRYDP
jgi:hypothetical protein